MFKVHNNNTNRAILACMLSISSIYLLYIHAASCLSPTPTQSKPCGTQNCPTTLSQWEHTKKPQLAHWESIPSSLLIRPDSGDLFNSICFSFLLLFITSRQLSLSFPSSAFSPIQIDSNSGRSTQKTRLPNQTNFQKEYLVSIGKLRSRAWFSSVWVDLLVEFVHHIDL